MWNRKASNSLPFLPLASSSPRSSRNLCKELDYVIKRWLLFFIFVCLLILMYLAAKPNISPPVVTLWTERNTKFPKKESIIPESFITLPHITKDITEMKKLDTEWRHMMLHDPIVGIDFSFNKGFSEKFRVVFESGYVALAKPLVSATELEAGLLTNMKTVDYYSIDSRKRSGKRSGFVDHRLIQGWAEIAAFHVDRVLGLYRKPPIVGRQFDNHSWFAFDSSVHSLRYRNAETFEYPMAMVAWLEGVHSASPDYNTIGSVLVMENERSHKDNLDHLRSTSDIIVFDFLIDDHDKHNVQNWQQFGSGQDALPLVWDSGLGWLHGPDGDLPECSNLLCGPKEWRIATPEWDDTNCRPICRFHGQTIQKLREMDAKDNTTLSLGNQVKNALLDETLYPVFQYGEFRATSGSKTDVNMVHFKASNFYDGLDNKVHTLIKHVDQCIEIYGPGEVLL